MYSNWKSLFVASITFLATGILCVIGKEADFLSPVITPEKNDGFENLGRYSRQLASDSAFIQKRLFNTSIALTVPLFSFTLPQRASPGSTVDLANQAIFGLFALLVTVFVFAVPILFTGSRPSPITGRSNDQNTNSILNNLMGSKQMFNMMDTDVRNNIGLDPENCLKKTICEAHHFPERHGMLAVPFQVFFPPPANGTSESRASVYRLAAKDGKNKRQCGKLYRCFFDILDLTGYMIDWYKYASNTDEDIRSI